VRGRALDTALDTALDESLGAAVRGGPPPMVLVTAHPSAVLRLRGRSGWDEAFGRLVDDLRVAAELADGAA
jgi:uracil-DNA glycosylase